MHAVFKTYPVMGLAAISVQVALKLALKTDYKPVYHYLLVRKRVPLGVVHFRHYNFVSGTQVSNLFFVIYIICRVFNSVYLPNIRPNMTITKRKQKYLPNL